MSTVQKIIDYDIAIEVIAEVRANAGRRKLAAASEEDRQSAIDTIKVCNIEENILNTPGMEDAKLSVYDKVFNYYVLMLKES